MGPGHDQVTTLSDKRQEGEAVVAPPSCNTGGLRTGRVSKPAANRSLIDWVQFTIPGEDVDLHGLMEWLAPGRTADWVYEDFGWFRYRKMARLGHISVLWDGQTPDMGVHVQLTGLGCREMEGMHDGHDWQVWLHSILLRGGHFSRLDIAFDDVEGLVQLKTVQAAVEAGTVVTRYRNYEPLERWRLGKQNKRRGHGCQFGSRGNGSHVVFYDKRLEQGLDPEVGHWVRCEVRWENENADRIVVDLANEGWSSLAGNLLRVLDFKKPNLEDKNRSRWETADWWATFLKNAEKMRPSSVKRVLGVPERFDYARRQLARTIAFLGDADLGLLNWLLREGREKLTKWDRKMIELWRRDPDLGGSHWILRQPGDKPDDVDL